MKRRIYPSWILAWGSLGLMLGVVLSTMTKDYFIGFCWLVIGTSLLLVSLMNRKVYIIGLAIIAGLLIGLWRGSLAYPEAGAYDRFINRQVKVSGTVSEDISVGKDGFKEIKLKDVNLFGKPSGGMIWLSTNAKVDIKRSDRLLANGELSKGFGNFAGAIYRANVTRVVRLKHGDIALEIRDWFSAKIHKAIKDPQASLGIGFLTGQHTNLPEDLVNNLRILGLTHIIVASGYNLTILVRFARRGLMRISKYTATLGSGLLIGGFIMVTGSSPSMTRAGLITGLSLAAWYYGRKIHPLVLLPFSAAVTVLISPRYLWGDLSWYLSFTAFTGVIILSPLLLNYFWGKDEPNAILRVVIETMSAQILTAPIIAYSFGQYAPLALISNVLILPLIPLAMLLTFIAGLGAVFIAAFSSIIGLPAQLLLNYMTFTVSKLASLPAAQGNISFPLPYMVCSYIFIMILCVWLWRRTGHNFAEDSVVE